MRIRTIRYAMSALSMLLAGGGVLIMAPSPARAEPTVAEGQSWYLNLLRIREAHKISTGKGVTVGLVDSGVDATHKDLKGRVLPGAGAPGLASDGLTDPKGHGTGMAGIIVAQGSGPDRVLGIAPGATILPYASSADGKHLAGASEAGIRWAADQGVQVLNLSFASAGDPTPGEVEAINYALSKDVVIVAAAGNLAIGQTTVSSPAKIRGVIGVTGIGKDGNFWTAGSAQGNGAVLSAPAEDIYTTGAADVTGYEYVWESGTSDATAIVSGVAALIRAKYPDMDANNVIKRLISTATDKGEKGWDGQYGDGIVNPMAALTADVPTVDSNPLLPKVVSSASVPPAVSSSPFPDEARPPAEKDDGGLGISLVGDPMPLYVIGGVLVGLMTFVMVMIALRSGRRKTPPPAFAQHGFGPPPQQGYPPQHGFAVPPQGGYLPAPGPQHPPHGYPLQQGFPPSPQGGYPPVPGPQQYPPPGVQPPDPGRP